MKVQVRTNDEWDQTCQWSVEEVEHYLMGPFDGGVPGLVRRVRRILDVSQRGLAALIGVSQSVVARWETGRTSPRVSRMHQLLRLTGLVSTVRDLRTGEEVEPMRDDGARDRGGRRYPAHVDLTVTGWYVPRGLECTAEPGLWRARSRRTGQPRVRYATSAGQRWLWRRILGTPVDQPSTHQLVAEAQHLDDLREARFGRLHAAHGHSQPPRFSRSAPIVVSGP